MICLGIEGTAHTFGIGIVEFSGKILANERDSFSTESGGMIPNEVASHHEKVADIVLEKALKKANLTMNDICLISFSKGPGLAPCLINTMRFAKKIARKHGKPLVGVNHIAAHLEIGKLVTNTKDPVYIFVSGANTQILIEDKGEFRIMGECLSAALGNALDKFARSAGLGFPGGPKIEEIAAKGKVKGKYIGLPYTVKGMDVDFSGIVTKAEQLLRKGVSKEDLAFSLQETCFSMVAEVTERAMAHANKKEAIVVGGVAANKRFCEMLDKMCFERGGRFYPVPIEYCGDNGAMIAWCGVVNKEKATKDYDNIDINPRWRIDGEE